MAIKRDAQTGKSDGSPPVSLFPPELAEMGRKHIAGMIEAQTEIFEAAQEWGRDCFASARSETILASDAATKLMAARSIPETGIAYQEWLERWARRFGEDSQRLFADGQKLMEASNRFLSNGWNARGA